MMVRGVSERVKAPVGSFQGFLWVKRDGGLWERREIGFFRVPFMVFYKSFYRKRE